MGIPFLSEKRRKEKKEKAEQESLLLPFHKRSLSLLLSFYVNDLSSWSRVKCESKKISLV